MSSRCSGTVLRSFFSRPTVLLGICGLLSLMPYTLALAHGPFRPHRIEPFFGIFALAFVLYALASWSILRERNQGKRRHQLLIIFVFAGLFNLILLPSFPTLSDDMFRYVWDGRVQAAGINPYRYPSNARELRDLRDPLIWKHMNRPDAVTIYPPAAELFFAFMWRIAPDSISAYKLAMIVAVFIAGWLLVLLLKTLKQAPERVIIFLWNPLLIFEVAHSGHVDALYLPLLIGAMLLRARSVSKPVNVRYEVGIGLLLGLATLAKLYPLLLLVPLWSVRTEEGRRSGRLALPITAVLTILLGYALYTQADVNTLGFLPQYGREHFNVAPPVLWAAQWASKHGVHWYSVANTLMPLLIGLVSVYFLLFPAYSSRQAIVRCMIPIGIYLLVNHNLFSWYILWMLPLIALELNLEGRLFTSAFAWWVFSGTVVLSYTFFINWEVVDWAIWVEFLPLYGFLLLSWIMKRINHDSTRLNGRCQTT